MNETTEVIIAAAAVIGVLGGLFRWLIKGLENRIPRAESDIIEIKKRLDEHRTTTEQERRTVIDVSMALAVMAEAMTAVKEAIQGIRLDVRRNEERQERHEQWHFQREKNRP